MKKWLLILCVLNGCAGDTDPAIPVTAQPEPTEALSGEVLFNTHCADCHIDTGATKAPSLVAMREMDSATIAFALTNGKMKTQAAPMSFEQRLSVTEFIASTAKPYQTPESAWCDRREIDVTPKISRWGFDANNSGRIPTRVSEITAENVSQLSLKWSFGLPKANDARSQPVITEDTLYIASVPGHLFALDRYSGCVKWQYESDIPLRTALTLGTIDKARSVLFFGDAGSGANALDALTGKLIWRTETRVAEHSILTGALVQHGDHLIVPVSMYEVALARDPNYECCKAHGAVMMLDAAKGEILWTTHMTEDAVPQGQTSVGVRRWGPSGVAVWSTPTVDASRGLVYVGTAQNASEPATPYSDSVLALSLDTGKVVWHFQAMAGDVYNDGCAAFPAGPNCPKSRGPDFDIGASVILTQDSNGKAILLAGQKSGDVYALDPDNKGKLVWHQRVGSGSPLGGVHWGLAVSGNKVFAPVSDPEYPFPGYFPKPGVYALDVDNGDLIWEHRVKRGCDMPFLTYLQRDALYPDCPFYYGFSAAPTAVNDLLFVTSLDGRVTALSEQDGRVLWQYETIKPFATVNGVKAHGGSTDVAGVQAVGRMLYVQSGYSLFGQLPGNVLLAFELNEPR